MSAEVSAHAEAQCPEPPPGAPRPTDPYGVRSRSHGPEENSPCSPPRRNPSDWAACTALTGSPVSATVRDQISPPDPVELGPRAPLGRQFLRTGAELRDRRGDEPAQLLGRRQSGLGPASRRAAAAPRPTAAPVTAPGTAAVAADSSTDSSSSPADTVTSSVTSSPFSYGFASRAARTASTSKEGGRPKTASAVPAACNRTAAERS
ncbi:hypothetical protein GCM10023238_01080 [Streptomyces heliomycini]